MNTPSPIDSQADSVHPETRVRKVVGEMLMDKVRATLGDPSQPCSLQAYLQTGLELMLVGDRLVDLMCGEARMLKTEDLEARLCQLIDQAFGDSYQQLSDFYSKQIQFTITLIFMQLVDMHKELTSGALKERDYDQEIIECVNFQLGRFSREFARAATGRDQATG